MKKKSPARERPGLSISLDLPRTYTVKGKLNPVGHSRKSRD
jgi:hypothetical protein